MKFDRDARSDDPFYHGLDDIARIDGTARRRSRGALPPQAFSARRGDGGLYFTIIDRSPLLEGTGAQRYDIYWAHDVDLGSKESIDQGFARAVSVLTIPAPGKEGRDATRFLAGTRFLRGFYYCVGVDATNTPGEPTAPISLNDSSNSDGYPDEVTHFAVSESGENHNGTTYSAISFIYQAPNDPDFAGVQFFVKDYPVIGEIYQTHFIRYVGSRGGTAQGKVLFALGRRPGTGTITSSIAGVMVGTGTEFFAEANAGDLIEARSHTQEIDLVSTSSQLVVTGGAWGGVDLVDLADWWIIPEVTIYAVSIGKDGAHREDIESAPSAAVHLDGLLSAPVAPVLTANEDSNGVSTIGEVIRLEWDQLDGTEIKQYHLYRGTGAGLSFDDCAHVDTVPHDPYGLSSGRHQYNDTKFTITEKENNQVFTYYLVAENVREQRSDPSAAVEVACKLNTASSGDPSIPSRSGVKNLFYNAALAGTDANDVDSADTTQDAFNNIGGPPSGWARWTSILLGGAATKPKHADNDQVKFTAPGVGGAAYIYQDINGWDGSPGILRSGTPLTLQFLITYDGATIPDGEFIAYLDSRDGGVSQEYAPLRYRDPADDALKYYPGDTSSAWSVSTADLVDDWMQVFAVFRPTETIDMDTLRVVLGWDEGTVGEIRITQPMLSYGEELANWTGEMVDTALRHPRNVRPPVDRGDGWGRRNLEPYDP